MEGGFKLTADFGIVQSRSDFEDGEDGKNISECWLFLREMQVFVLVKFGEESYFMYDIGQVYFNLKLRTQC